MYVCSVVFPFRYAQVGVVKRAPKARASKGGGGGGMLSQKSFICRASEMPFPFFCREKFH